MVSIFKKKLDQLMGQNRNQLLSQISTQENYYNEDVCKHFLVTICPYTLFPNTKYDMGICPKRHDQIFKKQFHSKINLKRLIHEKNYIEGVLKVFGEKIQIVDNKVKKLHSKQDIPLYKGEIPPEFQDKIDNVESQINRLLEDIKVYGEQGDFEKYEELSKEVEDLRETQKNLKFIAVNPTLASKQMKICEVCGAIQAINDVEKRNLTHLDGKLHKGFQVIRNEMERLNKRLETVLLKIEVQKEVEGNEEEVIGREKKIEKRRDEREVRNVRERRNERGFRNFRERRDGREVRNFRERRNDQSHRYQDNRDHRGRRGDRYERERYPQRREERYRPKRYYQLIMNFQNKLSEIIFYALKGYYWEALQLCQQSLKATKEPVLIAYSAFFSLLLKKTKEYEKFQRKMEGQIELLLCSKYIQNLKGEEKENQNTLQFQSESDFILSNMAIMDAIRGSNSLIIAIQKQKNINHYLFEVAKAIKELTVNYENFGESLTQEKFKRQLTKIKSVKPNCSLLNLLKLLFYQAIEDQENLQLIVSEGVIDNKFEKFIKMDIFIINQNFEEFQQCLLSVEENLQNLLFLEYKLFHALIMVNEVRVKEVFQELSLYLTRNYNQYLEIWIPFIKMIISLSVKNDKLCHQCLSILDQIDDSTEVFQLQGELMIKLQNYNRAENYFRSSLRLDEQNSHSILSLIRVQIYQRNLSEAETSLDFQEEVFQSLNQKSIDLLFLKSILKFLKFQQNPLDVSLEKECNKNFQIALQEHLQNKKKPFCDVNYYIKLNPSFIVEICKFFIFENDLSYTLTMLRLDQKVNKGKLFTMAQEIIQIILDKIPGMTQGQILMGKSYIVSQEFDKARNILDFLIDKDNKNQDAIVNRLFLELLTDKNNGTHLAQEKMEALSNVNFEIVKNPHFLYLKAQIQINQKKSNEAIQLLEKAEERESNCSEMYMIEIKTVKALIFSQINKISESKKLIKQCIINYSESPFAILIILANVEIHLKNQEAKKAIQILKNVESSNPQFNIAQKKLSQIYKNTIHQIPLFLQCYIKIYKCCPSEENLWELSLAYFSVSEFQKTIEYLNQQEQIYGYSQRIAYLKIECLMHLNRFKQCSALIDQLIEKDSTNPKFILLKLDLLIKTSQFEEVDEKIKDLQNTSLNWKDSSLILEFYSLQLHYNFPKVSTSVEIKKNQLEFHQKRINLMKEIIEKKGISLDLRKKLGKFLFEKAEFLVNYGDNQEDIKNLVEEAIENYPDQDYLLMLNRIHYEMGDVDTAKSESKNILKKSFLQRDSLILFADCLLRQSLLINGIKGFTKMHLKEQETDQGNKVLLILFFFHKNNNTLNQISSSLEIKVPIKFQNQQFFIKGLDFYYKRHYREAIEYLSKAYQDSQLREEVLEILLDIYLHQNGHLLFSHFFNPKKFVKIQDENMKIMRRLVDCFYSRKSERVKDLWQRVLDSFEFPSMIKNQVVYFQGLLEKSSYSRYHSFILYFLCIWSLRLKSKSQIKLFMSKTKQLEYSPFQGIDIYYFRSVMLAVDSLLNKDRLETAEKLILKCLEHDKSSLLVYDYQYLLLEKQKKETLETLSIQYDLSMGDPNIGYRLAKNLLNQKNYQLCYKICKEILSKHPKFTKIKTELLKKCKEELITKF